MEPPPEAVLEGVWQTTVNGNVDVDFTFDADGRLTRVAADAGDQGTATVDVTDATSVVDGNNVTITFEVNSSSVTFEGILAADENSMTGMVSRSFNIGDIDVTVPQDDVTLTRDTGNGGGGDEGDAVAGGVFFMATCAACHGADAAGGIGPNIQGATADDIMGALQIVPHTALVVTDQNVLDLAAFLATVPNDFTEANVLNGGVLYDMFWIADGVSLSAADLEIVENSADFFRCKQCHAWDHFGSAASYIDRAPRTTRPNVSPLNLTELAQTASAQELFDAIKTGSGATRRALTADLSTYDPAVAGSTVVGDQMPDYGAFLADAQIWDLVKYFKEGILDTTALYDIATEGEYPTGTRTFTNVGKDGDSTNGNMLYAQKCSACHGANGRDDAAFPIADGADSVGSFARGKPYELWHKVKFGQQGSSMGPQGVDSLEDMKDLLAALSDEVAYPDPVE